MTVVLDPISTVPGWSKVKFFYDHRITNLVATSTATGYSAMNVVNMLDLSYWKATSSANQYLTFTATGPYTANYLAIGDHNLGSLGATVALQCSSDNFSSDIVDCFTPFVQADDKAFAVEFSAQNKTYWRLKLTTLMGPPFIGKCIWGQETVLHWAAGSFDPHAENNKANVTVSGTGYLLGIHDTYTERQINLTFRDAFPAVYAKIKAWRDAVGLNNFFMAWEITNSPDDVYIVRSNPGFNNPLKYGGTRRDINLSLTGRKE